MSWLNFQKSVYDLTEKEIKILSDSMMSEYTTAYRHIYDQLKDAYAKLTGIAPENYYNEILKFNRLENLLKSVIDGYKRNYRNIGQLAISTSKVGFSNAYYRKLYTLEWYKPISFALVPDELIELAIFGTADNWKKYTKALAKKFGPGKNYVPQVATIAESLSAGMTTELNKIKTAITQGLISGQSFTKTANEIKGIIGTKAVDQGLITYSGAKANAMRIVRTESIRTMNAASYAASKLAESQGIEIQKELSETLDNRTRPACARADGQRRGLDEPFSKDGDEGMYPGAFSQAKHNVNCRGTTIDIFPDWEPSVRRGRNPTKDETSPDYGKNEVFTMKNFDEWSKDKGLKKNKYGQLL